jgi:hypothetical protein
LETNMTLTNEPGGSSPEMEPYLVLAALADGERVDPSDLRSALADPAAREYLVDLIALRHAVAGMPSVPQRMFEERRRLRTRAKWVTAVAAVFISLTTGYFAGQRTAAETLSPAPTIETVIDLGSSASVAPRPTQVVSLRPGVNWTETTGGH